MAYDEWIDAMQNNLPHNSKPSMQDLTEAIAKADFETLEDAVACLDHHGTWKGILAVKRLVLAGEGALEVLIDIIRKRDSRRLDRAIEILGSIYKVKHALHPEFAQLLFRILQDEPHGYTGHKAAEILSILAADYPLPEFHDYFIDALCGDDRSLQESAIQYLVKSKSASSIPLLMLLLKTNDTGIEYTIQKALREIGSPEALCALHEWEKRNKNDDDD